MESDSRLFRASRVAAPIVAASMLLALLPSSASAQAPPVPATFQATYSALNTYLVNFNTKLNAKPAINNPFLSAGNLKNADANAGPQLVNTGAMLGIQLQLQELRAMGVQAIAVEVGFPILYEPFLTSQGQSYTQFAAFYQQVAAMVRAAGLKLIVENDTLLTNDVQAGWNPAPFYATLDWAQYQQARAQSAVTVAQTMQPDYFLAVEEPDTEAANSGQSQANTPSGSASLLSQMLTSLQQAGVPGMQVGAGTGTWQPNALQFIQSYVTLPVDFLDMHIYPVNLNNLPIALQIASTAAAAGKPVSMMECWMWKVSDSELSSLPLSQIQAREPFSFWAPLDAYFIQTIQNLASHTQMLFINPFNTELFSAYLPYNTTTENLTPSQILSEDDAQAMQNMGQAIFTSTAMSYYTSLVSPPDTIPPAVPTGLSGTSGNPTTASLTWNASNDNVGVAGYYVLRNGSVAGTTANLYYQDSGLTKSATYTYSIEAFDLAGNISAPSLPIHVTTRDVTPPTAPGNVAAVAASTESVNVTWSASTDNVGIGGYNVFWGVSPSALVQVGQTAGTVTSYTSYPLTAGSTYYYGVEAVDTSGNISVMSTIVSVTTPVPPAAPGNLSAIPVSTVKIGLTWSAAAGGGLPIQSYQVFRGTSASNLAQIATVQQTAYSDNNVSAGITYYYGVQAVDTGSDLSPMSSIVSVTTPVPPSAPGNLSATASSTAKIGLTWSAAASGGLAIQSYQVFRGTSASSLAQIATLQQTAYSDNNVTAGITYYYGVQAVDTGSDLSPMSTIVSVTTPMPPSAPVNLSATAASIAKINLTWSAAASGGLPIQSYQVFRGTSASNLAQIATVQQTAYSDNNVTAGATYYYGVQAIDTGSDLSPMSTIVSVTVPVPPSPPANLTATSVSTNTISLTWSAAASGGLPIQNYYVYRGASPSSLGQLAIVQQTSYNDSNVTAGTTYYYAVAAADTAGDLSALSITIPVTTLTLSLGPVTTYSIAGQVVTPGNVPLSGVTVLLSGSSTGSATTDSSGNFSFNGLPAGGTLTVTPSLGGYTFSPTSQTFNNLSASQTANFTASTQSFTISGQIAVSGTGH